MDRKPAELRVALYARVSSERQAEANTIAAQLAELHGASPRTAAPSTTTIALSMRASAAPP